MDLKIRRQNQPFLQDSERPFAAEGAVKCSHKLHRQITRASHSKCSTFCTAS